MDTTLLPAGKETGRPAYLNLEQALQTYPQWDMICSEPPFVVESLDEGLTNCCYFLQSGMEQCVLRLNARNSRAMGLDRVNEQVALRHAAAAEIGPQVIYCSPYQGVLVTRYLEGRHWSEAEAGTELNIERLAMLLKRVHALPATGKQLIPGDVVARYLRGIKDHFVAIPERFNALHTKMEQVIYQLNCHRGERRLCHNDPVLGNIIDSGDKLFLIDWEYAAMGDPFFDLAVVVHNLKFNERQLQQLLETYLGRLDDTAHRWFLYNYATYIYIDMLWYWFQSAAAPRRGYGTIAESKLDTLVAILHELGL